MHAEREARARHSQDPPPLRAALVPRQQTERDCCERGGEVAVECAGAEGGDDRREGGVAAKLEPRGLRGLVAPGTREVLERTPAAWRVLEAGGEALHEVLA